MLQNNNVYLSFYFSNPLYFRIVYKYHEYTYDNKFPTNIICRYYKLEINHNTSFKRFKV